MNILEQIITYKNKEVKRMKDLYPVKLLEHKVYFQRNTNSLSGSLGKNRPGIIAEFKRKSPSAGQFGNQTDLGQVIRGYVESGAAALSVLTDEKYFGGNIEDLSEAREKTDHPILRKDFIVDEYQIIEARAAGADAVLLIAEILTENQVYEFTGLARSFSLEVILEIHHSDQLNKLCDGITIVGVNNRNLVDLTVDVNRSFELASSIPGKFMKISESGISSPDTIIQLTETGYQGFLIGEYFMKHDTPQEACKKLIEEILADD
ncbi:MAG: hypothetical protein AMS27_00710 [Bacteroides sp. SM23_62_1]|nr:MAG: hypothetical protein AMS27_00710 [Bacteroides sp. SM23_62_1]